MSASVPKKKEEPLFRVNTRILESQDAFIKTEVKRLKKLGNKKIKEGELTRILLAKGIAVYQKENKL